MTETNVAQPPTQRFALRSDPPIRALVVASISAVLGAALVVSWGAQGLPAAVPVVGALLMGFALALVVAAVLAYVRLRQLVVLDVSGITLRNRYGQRSLMWSEIKEVRLSGVLLQLLTAESEQAALEIVKPRGRAEPAFAELLSAISLSLDADRGYGT